MDAMTYAICKKRFGSSETSEQQITQEQQAEIDAMAIIRENIKIVKFNRYGLWFNNPDNSIPFKLPYLYTPNVKWQTTTSQFNANIDANITEFGFDVSSGTFGDSTGRFGCFARLNNTIKIVVTGNSKKDWGHAFHEDKALQYVKLEPPTDTALSTYTSKDGFYGMTFKNCQALKTIDTVLDFSHQNKLLDTFLNCYVLENIKIKAKTLSCDLNMKSTKALTSDSVLQIFNGCIDNAGGGFMITFNMVFNIPASEASLEWFIIDDGTNTGTYRKATQQEHIDSQDVYIFDALTNIKGVIVGYGS